LTDVNGTVFFAAGDADGRALWKSDGTAAGTVLVGDIYPPSSPSDLTDVNGTLFFVVFAPSIGDELWKSDGTTAGTVPVKDINPGSSSSRPSNLADVNGTLFFAAFDPTNGRELWKSDGTAARTVLVRDINPGSGHSFPGDLANTNGTLFFAASDPTNGRELWKSDGTAAGTVLVGDINPGPDSSNPHELTAVGGRLFFAASEPNTGTELWALGSSAGCGNGVLDPGEGCDAGASNGTPESCCGSDCTLRAAGETCRPTSSACDIPDTCTGTTAACPSDEFAPAGTPCPDDGDLCSVDVCDGAGSCSHAFEPAPGCTAPIEAGAARLTLVERTSDEGDLVSWKWAKGPVTPNGEFGDPTTTTAYTLCIYDESSGTPRLALSATAPAGGTCGPKPCWAVTRNGFRYANRAGTPDGLQEIVLKARLADGQASICVKGQGVNLKPFVKDPSVIAQLKATNGACWEATYSTATVNGTTMFKAKSD